jgi:hypothetical protein
VTVSSNFYVGLRVHRIFTTREAQQGAQLGVGPTRKRDVNKCDFCRNGHGVEVLGVAANRNVTGGITVLDRRRRTCSSRCLSL